MVLNELWKLKNNMMFKKSYERSSTLWRIIANYC